MKSVLKFKRPARDVDYFNISKIEDESKRSAVGIWFMEHMTDEVATVVDNNSADDLTLTRTVTWKSDEAYITFDEAFQAKFPWFVQARQDYCDKVGITLTMSTVE